MQRGDGSEILSEIGLSCKECSFNEKQPSTEQTDAKRVIVAHLTMTSTLRLFLEKWETLPQHSVR